jgi:hypothetical protein
VTHRTRNSGALIWEVLEVVSILKRRYNDGRLTAEVFNVAMGAFKSEVIDSDDFRLASTSDTLILDSLEYVT